MMFKKPFFDDRKKGFFFGKNRRKTKKKKPAKARKNACAGIFHCLFGKSDKPPTEGNDHGERRRDSPREIHAPEGDLLAKPSCVPCGERPLVRLRACEERRIRKIFIGREKTVRCFHGPIQRTQVRNRLILLVGTKEHRGGQTVFRADPRLRAQFVGQPFHFFSTYGSGEENAISKQIGSSRLPRKGEKAPSRSRILARHFRSRPGSATCPRSVIVKAQVKRTSPLWNGNASKRMCLFCMKSSQRRRSFSLRGAGTAQFSGASFWFVVSPFAAGAEKRQSGCEKPPVFRSAGSERERPAVSLLPSEKRLFHSAFLFELCTEVGLPRA